MICTLHQIHLGDQIQKKDMGSAHSKYGGEERCIQGGKVTLGRPRHRWEDNIKTDLQDVGW